MDCWCYCNPHNKFPQSATFILSWTSSGSFGNNSRVYLKPYFLRDCYWTNGVPALTSTWEVTSESFPSPPTVSVLWYTRKPPPCTFVWTCTALPLQSLPVLSSEAHLFSLQYFYFPVGKSGTCLSVFWVPGETGETAQVPWVYKDLWGRRDWAESHSTVLTTLFK